MGISTIDPRESSPSILLFQCQLTKGMWLETNQLLEVQKLSWLLVLWKASLLRYLISMEVQTSHFLFF